MLKTYNFFLQNYKKEALIGRGTFSKVYEAVSLLNGQMFALKEIEIWDSTKSEEGGPNKSWEILSSQFPEIFLGLIEPHPCIGLIHEFFVRADGDSEILCILMEFLPMSLEQQINLFRKKKLKFSLTHFLTMFHDITTGMNFYFFLWKSWLKKYSFFPL